MKSAVVYWIKSPVHSDASKEGYIGVTVDLGSRILRHQKEAKSNKHANPKLQQVLLTQDYVVEVVYSGLEEECYKKELELRPKYRIGWNIVPGGHGGSTIKGMKMSEEFRQKQSERMKGNTIAKGNHRPKSEEHKKKIGLSNKGISKPRTPESRLKQAQTMKAIWAKRKDGLAV